MSKARIIALNFDSQTLPLPVSVEQYSAMETETLIIFFEDAANPKPISYQTLVNDSNTGFVRGLPEGDYTITVHAADKEKPYMLYLQPVDTGGNVIGAPYTLDLKKYLEDFEQAAISSLPPTAVIQDMENFERSFSREYMKNTFSNAFEGSDDFWTLLYREIDVATAPLNVNLQREAAGQPPKQVIFTQDPAFLMGGPSTMN